MVAQPHLITKSPAGILSRRFFGRRPLASALLCLLGWAGITAPALAWIKMEPPHGVNAALVYGMRHQKMNLATLLGDNWVEGENGSLLNVYSPFMMLATKAAKAGLSSQPSKSDLEAARKRFARDVKYYSDPQNRLSVKFAVAFYGNSPDFAKRYSARIVGIGRGKEFNLKTERQSLDQVADAIENGNGSGSYEAINSYYFPFSDLQNLDEFRLELTSPDGPPLSFSMRGERLY